MTNLKPLIAPIILSTTMAQKIPEQGGYSRVDNPTRLSLEKKLAKQEQAKFALAFSSGSAAIANILAILKSDDEVICHQEIYEGTLRLLIKVFSKFYVKVKLTDICKLKSVSQKTRIIWLENVTNSTLQIIDVKKICQKLKQKNLLIVVDNTFATPVFQNPLFLGADVVVHSLTKFISGHHDVTAGAIMLNDKNLFKQLKFLQHTIGAVPSPFDCFLIERSLETLTLRMKKHQENAQKVTDFLKSNSHISKVSFPGFSGLVAFWIKGNKQPTLKFLAKLKHIKICHSLGGTQSTIMYPVSMMTLSTPIDNNLVRLSVGLENDRIIINDLRQALS
ncbi:MAG: aminotransferase class I/II-fold pyridoxal phosphate-dependent enzyme [Patescibacteria group bacterium]|nr:aminotransferase class I/II-fold pyridoxal phosphate-dependent enzyme [Patescibacteria group bacterium]